MNWINPFCSLRFLFRGEIFISAHLWRQLVAALKERSDGCRESGAFLLGVCEGHRRFVKEFVLYDDLSPGCLHPGCIMFDNSVFSKLWDICGEKGMRVVADIHVHPGAAYLSAADRENPMIREIGHCALILPNYAQTMPSLKDIGIYQYLGDGNWREMAKRNLRIRRNDK